MHVSRRLLSYQKWNAQATEWLFTRWGRRARVGLLCGITVSVPVVTMLVNGPLIGVTFPKRFSVEDLPADLSLLAQQEYERFLEKESRVPRDAVITYHISKDIGHLDTVSAGSLGVRTGLHTALPFFARFNSTEEALQYLRQHSAGHLPFLGQKLPVDWNSPEAEELAATFVISENAKRFVLLRDHIANDGYEALAQGSISWASWTTFSGMFTHFLFSAAKMGGGTAAAFVVITSICTGLGYFGYSHWHQLYRFVADIHADSNSATSSFAHAEGGKEYYWKQLKRNRILRDMHPQLYTKVTASGDIRGSTTPIITRFDHLKDVNKEDDEIKDAIVGDD